MELFISCPNNSSAHSPVLPYMPPLTILCLPPFTLSTLVLHVPPPPLSPTFSLPLSHSDTSKPSLVPFLLPSPPTPFLSRPFSSLSFHLSSPTLPAHPFLLHAPHYSPLLSLSPSFPLSNVSIPPPHEILSSHIPSRPTLYFFLSFPCSSPSPRLHPPPLSTPPYPSARSQPIPCPSSLPPSPLLPFYLSSLINPGTLSLPPSLPIITSSLLFTHPAHPRASGGLQTSTQRPLTAFAREMEHTQAHAHKLALTGTYSQTHTHKLRHTLTRSRRYRHTLTGSQTHTLRSTEAHTHIDAHELVFIRMHSRGYNITYTDTHSQTALCTAQG